MNRRDVLLLALASASPLARAQHYRTYSRCLPDYLTSLAEAAYKNRNADLDRVKTPADVRARQDWVRQTFWKLAGGQPERTPLNLRTLNGFVRQGYKVEKLVYESRPGLHIPANLYIPTEGKPPYPGVLFQMGHSLNGKAADPYQKCCQALARLGYVVLAFDPMGQGERTYYPRPGGTLTRLDSADDEHTVPGKQMLLVGDTAMRMQVWDAVRSLDVLADQPMVDSKRLGSTGQSGGGTLTMLLAAIDDRLAAAAVSCGNTENVACAGFIPPGSVDDAEQNFVDSGPIGFDRWDVLYPLAPKPLLVSVSARDFFGTYSPNYLTSGREEFAKLRRMYEILDASDRIRWVESPVPHALAPNLRLDIYNFFEKWLRGSNRTISSEPPVEPEPEATLYVGKTGNVVRDFDSKTPQQIAKEQVPAEPARSVSADELARFLKVDRVETKVDTLGRANWGDVTVEGAEAKISSQVFLPAWIYVPKSQSGPLLLVLEPRGRNARWREDDMYHQLAMSGALVCAFDIRGIGDLSPEVGRGNPYYTRSHSTEDAYAWGSMILGKPLLGQRVTDILAMTRAMRSRAPGRRTVLAALGHMTIPALIAAALDPAIERVYLSKRPKSYASVVTSETYEWPFANFAPGILRLTDLPSIAAALGDRLRESESWNSESLLAV
jgi:cephalosporin-C deacetylase-like acetyl esterase